MASDEDLPGGRAPTSGLYEELNVFGTPTGTTVFVSEGDGLPGTPRGFSWRPLAERSVAELRERAKRYRAMAATATTEQAMEGLEKLAERFDALADRRERE